MYLNKVEGEINLELTKFHMFCMQVRAYHSNYPSAIARGDIKMADDWLRLEHHDLLEPLLYRGIFLVGLFDSNFWGKIS